MMKDNLHLIRFLVLMRGARTPPPNIDAPVKKIPLYSRSLEMAAMIVVSGIHGGNTHHPAPRTLKPKQRAIPIVAHA
jgi:hypothetical protein